MSTFFTSSISQNCKKKEITKLPSKLSIQLKLLSDTYVEFLHCYYVRRKCKYQRTHLNHLMNVIENSFVDCIRTKYVFLTLRRYVYRQLFDGRITRNFSVIKFKIKSHFSSFFFFVERNLNTKLPLITNDTFNSKIK